MRHLNHAVSRSSVLIGILLFSVAVFANNSWEATPEYEALVEAALQEGSLTLYTSGAEAAMASLGREFERTFPGMAIHMLRLPSGALNARYGTETSSGVAQVDVFNSATIDLFEQHVEWWQPITPELVPSSVDWPASARKDHYMYTGHSGHGLVYNTNLVDDPPSNWEDVLDPRYKDDCLIIDPRTSPTFVSFYQLLAEGYGDDFLVRLREQNCKFSQAGLPTSQEVAAGGAAIGFPVTVSQVVEPQQMGAPIARTEPSADSPVPAHGVVQYFGIPTNAPHPNAARLYLTWLLSPEVQSLSCELGGYGSPLEAAESCFSVPDDFQPSRSLSEEQSAKVMQLLGIRQD